MQRKSVAKNSGFGKEDKLFNFRPVFFAAVFLCLGIIFGYYTTLKGVSALWCLCLLPVGATPFLFCKKHRAVQALCAVLAMLLCFLLGVCGFVAQTDRFQACTRYDGTYDVVGKITDITEQGNAFAVELSELSIAGKSEKGKLVAYLSPSFAENLQLADKIVFRGYVQTQAWLESEYGFRASEISGDVRFRAVSVESLEKAGESHDLFLRIRARMREVLFANMDETTASVTMAVLTGDRSGMPYELLTNIRAGGIAHIFAVSGLHVGALYAFCILLIRKTVCKRAPKSLRLLFVLTVLAVYAGVCGFSASVLRAGVMCLLIFGGELIGISTDPLERVGAAAFAILAVSPVQLFLVGFQLSFLACLGIVLFCRPIENGLHALLRVAKTQEDEADRPLTIAERVRNAAISFVAVSLAAQTATSPVLLRVFGYLSGWSLLLNCILVPLISSVFSVLLLFVLLACVFPWAAGVLLYLPVVFWSFLQLTFEAVDFSTFALCDITLSIGSMLCYYASFLFLTDKWNIPKIAKACLSLVCFLAFGVTVFALNV